jgi:hypothetical protein
MRAQCPNTLRCGSVMRAWECGNGNVRRRLANFACLSGRQCTCRSTAVMRLREHRGGPLPKGPTHWLPRPTGRQRVILTRKSYITPAASISAVPAVAAVAAGGPGRALPRAAAAAATQAAQAVGHGCHLRGRHERRKQVRGRLPLRPRPLQKLPRSPAAQTNAAQCRGPWHAPCMMHGCGGGGDLRAGEVGGVVLLRVVRRGPVLLQGLLKVVQAQRRRQLGARCRLPAPGLPARAAPGRQRAAPPALAFQGCARSQLRQACDHTGTLALGRLSWPSWWGAGCGL